ncbi:OmpA family protein [Pontibacter fetidus]|uniref:OmpA family protein n=1 Tax=Pontibacter fetidus TaxID=2700082 RepID=A0A6B2GXN2_9BACT|nr:hypothetical protein [Pontibacter fetidus]NDK55709.1 hypothetical protein [Pontibacter fetidus]
MKKIIYTIAFLLATGTIAHAQTPLKETGTDLADFILLENDVLLYARKETDGQYLYTEKRGDATSAKKELVLNTGTINALVGRSVATGEYYVYQKNGRNQEVISFYSYKEGAFDKTGERSLPKLKNHSQNLGLFLTEDKNTMVISAELGKSRGYEDLYVSQWENNRWTKPKNLGKSVNTRQAEFAPYMANDTLYFSRMEESEAYNYSAGFTANGQAGTPAKLEPVVNATGTYNAYYKKVNERQMWLSASTDNKPFHTAYLLEKPAPVAEETIVAEEVVEEALPAPVVKTKAATPGLTLPFAFNSIYMNLENVSALARFLNQQPEGTAFVIKGYSDGYGTAEVKENVSRRRARLIQQYIEKYFPAKNFTLEVENEVRSEKGQANRKAELYLMQ